MKKFINFESARKLARTLNIKNGLDWQNSHSFLRNKYPQLPSHPDRTYKGEWTNWKDFLSCKEIKTSSSVELLKSGFKYLTYEEAKEVLKPFNLHNSTDYFTKQEKVKKTIRKNTFKAIPSAVVKYYQKTGEWVNWYDFLGAEVKTAIIRTSKVYNFVNYEEAKKIIKPFGLKTSTDWYNNFKKLKPLIWKVIPSSPKSYYGATGEWKNWYDFLSSTFEEKFLTYKEAKAIVKPLMLQTGLNWKKRTKEERKICENIPCEPNLFYKKTGEWKNWEDFLSRDPKLKIRKRCSKEETNIHFAIKILKSIQSVKPTGSFKLTPKTITKAIETGRNIQKQIEYEKIEDQIEKLRNKLIN